MKSRGSLKLESVWVVALIAGIVLASFVVPPEAEAQRVKRGGLSGQLVSKAFTPSEGGPDFISFYTVPADGVFVLTQLCTKQGAFSAVLPSPSGAAEERLDFSASTQISWPSCIEFHGIVLSSGAQIACRQGDHHPGAWCSFSAVLVD